MARPAVRCALAVDQREWDALVGRMGGSFFHCYAYAAWESALLNARAVFITAADRDGQCIGLAVATCNTPRRWPFSRYCKTVEIGALPACPGNGPDAQAAILGATEDELRRLGVFRIRVNSYGAPHSENVLSLLRYDLADRHEFYVDLQESADAAWRLLTPQRKNKVRKGMKNGLQARPENSREGSHILWRLHAAALARHGVETSAVPGRIEATTRLLVESGRATLLVDYLAGEPVAALMYGVMGAQACTLMAGSNPAGNDAGAPSHLMWAMFELLLKDGISRVSLGGVSADDGDGGSQKGLYMFKKEFGALPVRQPAGFKTIARLGKTLSTVGSAVRRLAVLRRR
jgi:hypothetical protein